MPRRRAPAKGGDPRTGGHRLIPWAAAPAEMARLERAWAEELTALDPRAAPRRRESLRRDRERGELEVLLWSDRSGAAEGFVACQLLPPLGRRIVFLFLESRYRHRECLDSLFELLDRHEGGAKPVFASTDFYPGIPVEVQAPVLAPRGFVHVDQERMVFRSLRGVPEENVSVPVSLRHPVPSDIEGLIDLYVRSYRMDPTQLLWPQVRLREDAAYYIRGSFAGRSDLGPLVIDYSFVAEQHGRLVGAVLLWDLPGEGPFVSDLMVDPSARRLGVGRRLLIRALSTVRVARPEADVILTVDTQNRPARALYTSLGFVPVPPGPGHRTGAWLRRAAVEAVTGPGSDGNPLP